MKTPYIVVDAEANGLYPDKFHCIAVCNDDGDYATTDYQEMRDFLTNAEVIVGHNIVRWDIPNLERVLGIKIKARLIDTLPLSWALEPHRNRNKHGLAAHGEDLGIQKPKIEDWHNGTPEEYIHRCKEDTRINWGLWKKYWSYLMKLYDGDEEKANAYIDYLSFKMDCARRQEKYKWRIDKEKVKASILKMEAELEAKTSELARVMPQVPIMREKTYPAKPLKKNGTLSASGKAWYDFLEEQGLDRLHKDPVSFVHHFEDPNPGSTDQIKKWLDSLGWKPQTFKYKKDKETGKNRAIPQINKEAQHGGGVCESIKVLFEEAPELEVLDGLGILNHRLPILRGFLDNVDENDKIPAEIQGLTNTLRFKHAVIVNLPKVNRPYGEDVRGALIADEGKILCGADKTSLEDRLKQHFIFKFDPGFVEMVNKPGYDPHLALAVMGKAITQKQMDDYVQEVKNKGHPDKIVKRFRDVFKNGNYSCQYGAFPPKIALTAGISLEEAKKVFKAYWDLNWGIKAVADDQSVKRIGNQMWLLNPINGFYYSLREMKDIFSTLVQGTASYVFDIWVNYVTMKYDVLLATFHDELVTQVDDTEEDRQKIIEILNKSLEETNEFLQLNRRLDIEVQFGKRYADIH